jgi:CRP/FNR family cyclic AMP-dependent transcriptional regulator
VLHDCFVGMNRPDANPHPLTSVRVMAAHDAYLDHLAEVSLFSACTRKDLEKIARASDEVEVKAGRKLVEEGHLGHEFFLVLEGKAIVSRGGKELAEVGPGEYFGELAILDKGPRTATVVAKTDMKLLVLGQREFLGVLDEVPGLAYKLLRIMAVRLREADLQNVGH